MCVLFGVFHSHTMMADWADWAEWAVDGQVSWDPVDRGVSSIGYIIYIYTIPVTECVCFVAGSDGMLYRMG